LLELGIIVESESSFASPIVLVPKKDQSTRMCIDFIKLSKISKFDAYPMPRIYDLCKAHYISNLDFSKGYYQIPLSRQSRDKTAFITPFGLYECIAMPYGLASAPATFMRLMDRVLSGADEYAHAYFDDTSIFSHNWKAHIQHLHDVFTRIRGANLTITRSKYHLGGREVSVVGHIVGKGQIKVQPDKVRAVKEYLRPRSKEDVRSFLGLSGYYRKHIKNLSELALPLTDLTKKDKATIVKWSEACEKAFNDLKSALSAAEHVLKSPDFDKHFYLQVDASDRGLGAVLSQLDNQSLDHPIVFLSRKLVDRETNYPTVEKECLGITWAELLSAW
jgi:hypothetical protein